MDTRAQILRALERMDGCSLDDAGDRERVADVVAADLEGPAGQMRHALRRLAELHEQDEPMALALAAGEAGVSTEALECAEQSESA